MSLYNGSGLPFLPGYTFRDVMKSAYHRPQTLAYKNGFALPRRPTVGIGQTPLPSAQLEPEDIDKLSSETPFIDYGPSAEDPTLKFVPAHVALDKKALRFFGYFQQDVLHSPDEYYRVRHVVIYYHLEDDTMWIIEPRVQNSGLPQGKLMRRQRLPKNDQGEHYHWKDLNVGMDLVVYGVTYRITHCDAYTQEFLERQGILVNEPEIIPVDPYITHRTQPERCYITPSEFDNLKRFLTLDRKVLRFFALWEDIDSRYGETISPVTIHYFLMDDTVEVREIHQPNSGRDPFPILMRRQRLPKTIKAACEPFPRCVLEVSSQEVQEYFSPKDFRVGETVKLMGRSFLLYECDGFTKGYYQSNHPELEMKHGKGPKKGDWSQDRKWEVPPYNGFGSPEDSLQNCYSLVPKPPKKDVMKMLENDHKVLRYVAKLDSQNPNHKGRRFVLSYFLSNNMISIFEKPSRNSGIIAGKFLEKTRVLKPGFTLNDPNFYAPGDLVVGSTVEVFRHRFVLIDADDFVLKYLESISDQIPAQTLESLRKKPILVPEQEAGSEQSENQNSTTQQTLKENSGDNEAAEPTVPSSAPQC